MLSKLNAQRTRGKKAIYQEKINKLHKYHVFKFFGVFEAIFSMMLDQQV